MGYTDDGFYVLDTAGSGNSNSGHDYGTKLSENEKRDLIEYLKTPQSRRSVAVFGNPSTE
jgi:hypothetical protein